MKNNPQLLQTEFEKLFRDYFTPLVWYAMKYVKDQDTSREIVHTVFVGLWEKIGSVDFSKSVKPYLYTSVYNRSMNYIRDHRKFTDEEKIDPTEFVHESNSLESLETEARIYSAIESLPDKTREIFELSRFENKKYKEIAESLNISVKTVEARMSEALKILRVKLIDIINILIILMVDFFKMN